MLCSQKTQVSNVDLFPGGFLWERWCNVHLGDKSTVTTPKKREVEIFMWGSLPYLLKKDLQIIIDDLPDASEPGRTGQMFAPTVARVSLLIHSPVHEIRSQLHVDLGSSMRE